MKLGRLYPDIFKAIRRMIKEREKARQVDLAWKIHQRSKARPMRPFPPTGIVLS